MQNEKEKVSSIKDGVFTNFVELQDEEAEAALYHAFVSFWNLLAKGFSGESLGKNALEFLRFCNIRLIMPVEAYNKALEESKYERKN